MIGLTHLNSIQEKPLAEVHNNATLGYLFDENRAGPALAVLADRAILDQIGHRLTGSRAPLGLNGSLNLIFLDVLEADPCPVSDQILDDLEVQDTLFWPVEPPQLWADFERLLRNLYGMLIRKMTVLEMIEPAGFWEPGFLPASLRAWPKRSLRPALVREGQARTLFPQLNLKPSQV